MSNDVLDSGEGNSHRPPEFASRERGGHIARLQELYEKVAPALYAWTHVRTHGRLGGKVDPQDILQEVWLRALQGFESYDSSRSFKGWIIGITKNVLVQEYRKHAQAVRQGIDGTPSENRRAIENCPESVTSISTRLARDDATQRFLAYVNDLSADERMLVLYCGLEGYSCAQAASRLGMSPDKAAKRWQRARERMRASGVLRTLALETSS